MNSQGINSKTNEKNLTSRTPSISKKEESIKANQVDENSAPVVKQRAGRRRVFFNLLIGYQ